MGFGWKKFTAGPLSSSDVQGYLMDQANIVCTTSSRPSAPPDGQEIFETDTRRKAIWMAAEGRWQYMGPGPLGRVASAVATADVGSGAPETDVVLCPFVAVAGRRYKISWKFAAVDNAGGCTLQGTLYDTTGTKTQLDTVAPHTHNATESATIGSFVEYVPPAAGTRSLKVTTKTLHNTGITVVPAATNPVLVLVEDIGPA